MANAVVLLSQRGEGAHRLTLRLDPVELGPVEIVIDRSKDGPATISLTAARPETLLRLVRDHEQLSRALDQAGLTAEGRSVTFHLAPTEAPRGAPPASADNALASNTATGGQAWSGQASGGQGGGGQGAGADQSRHGAGASQSRWSINAETGLPDPAAGSSSQSRLLRHGIDITA